MSLRRRNFSLIHLKTDRKLSIPSSKSAERLGKKTGGSANTIVQNETPQLASATQMELLSKNFPSFPKNMMRYLIIRCDGRYANVYKELTLKGWVPHIKKETAKLLSKKCDKHLTTPYYHGVVLNEEQISRISSKLAKPNEFCTFAYQKQGIDPAYCLCLNIAGEITIKRINSPVVEEKLAETCFPVPDNREKDLSWIPNFAATSLCTQYNLPKVTVCRKKKHHPVTAVPTCL